MTMMAPGAGQQSNDRQRIGVSLVPRVSNLWRDFGVPLGNPRGEAADDQHDGKKEDRGRENGSSGRDGAEDGRDFVVAGFLAEPSGRGGDEGDSDCRESCDDALREAAVGRLDDEVAESDAEESHDGGAGIVEQAPGHQATCR